MLRDEFPDVTISKIRFLESRGLLDPERTPSGYRKFYEPDVDRLRWILRQQREHFLPLKVIKGRLENGMTDPEAPTPHLFEMGDPPPEREAQPVLVGAVSTREAALERAHAAIATLTPMAVASSPGGAGHRSGRSGLADAAPPVSNSGPTRAGTTGDAPTEAKPPSKESGGDPGHSASGIDEPATATAASSRRRRPAGARRPEPGIEAPPKASEAEPTAAGASGEQEHGEAPVSAHRLPSRSTAGLPGAGLSGASLTLAELASASGLEIAAVEELESFGLIAGRTVAGVHCYGEDAVFVAKLAARFAPYGIEARHLKAFKHASDRQTALYGQVVTPLLRQRNPEARARAVEELSELVELGEALMRCFSQASIRELTGG